MAREFTADDRWLFNNGEQENLHRFLGAHLDGDQTVFRVWAPNAERVSVVGDWNGWDPERHPMHASESGVWEITVSGAGKGSRYKYVIVASNGGRRLEKADPVAFHAETPPDTASIVWDLEYTWSDREWMRTRADHNAFSAPMSIYECHLGSWSKQGPLEYVALARGLADHIERTGFTHLQLMPVMEHPFDGSWGYQSTGYFAPTSRFGPPQGLMEFIDIMHRRGIGVILDWVPSHFAVDAHALARFDGTHLYEHSDPRQGFHPDWGSFIFNYGRNEVQSFLLSSAHYWMDIYHADGLRVDGVASMLYLDYSRKDGEWIPNSQGGRENLEAVSFLRKLNSSLYGRFPGTQTIAEESTAWPLVTRPTDDGGLGFGYKWDMGWMNDTLRYFGTDPVFRSYEDNHRLLTFRGLYAFSENYVLALSHDEVVHGKRSLLDKNPGDEWKRFAGLRSLLGYQFALPGKKLLFMGSEFGSPFEWNHEGELPFFLLDYEVHSGVMAFTSALNRLYRSTPALHLRDLSEDGFEWIEANDVMRSTIAFLRVADGHAPVLVVCNFTPELWTDYRLGVPASGTWTTLLSSDDREFGGSGLAPTEVVTESQESHGHAQSLRFDVPPMSVTFLSPAG